MRRLVSIAALVALVVLAGPLPAAFADDEQPAAEPMSFDDLDSRLQRDVANAARAYLDPEVEFLWKFRKQLMETFAKIAEADVLADIPFLRQVIYQGRHFLPRYSDSKWRKEASITEFKKTDTVYNNLKSERWRFTYVVPKNYPKERALTKVPRPQPAPLLVTLVEPRDTIDSRNQAEAYPGAAVLERHYPKDSARVLYEKWFLLAPVAPQAKFLESDGSIRHRNVTAVLTEFWRRYHVDYDRIVLDGAAPEASAVASAFPHVLAGLVLRGGKVETETVRNFAAVPVFVVGDKALEKSLKDAGHPEVTRGTDADLLVWLGRRKRTVPATFDWRMLNDDHKYANWIVISSYDFASPDRQMSVKTDRETNTIDISATGIERIKIFLSDEIVDLDKEVKLVLNGSELILKDLKRDFSQTFQKDADIRKTMAFGWLYPVIIEDLKLPEPEKEAPAVAEETPPPSEVMGSPEEEAEAKRWWDKAVAAEAEDNLVKARTYYGKARDAGKTSYHGRAKAKLAELE